MQLLIQPFEYIPFHRYCTWASQYGLWYLTNGARGWTPPEALRRVLEIYDQIKTCPVQEERYRLMGRIIDLHAENLWMISSLKGIPVPVVVSPRSGNCARGPRLKLALLHPFERPPRAVLPEMVTA